MGTTAGVSGNPPSQLTAMLFAPKHMAQYLRLNRPSNMPKKTVGWFTLLWVLLPAIVVVAQRPISKGPELQFIAVMSRHGVRSPLASNEQLNAYSAQPWPAWDVPIGYLTKQGQTLMKLMGAYDREYLLSKGLLSAAGCVDAEHFYFWADAIQRDIDSGQAIAQGMLPGCSLAVHSVPKGLDPLFSPVAAGIGRPDPGLAVAAISGRIGDHPEELTKTYRAGLEAMQEVLGKPSTRSLLDIPATLQPTATLAQIGGPLNMAAAIAENFVLEYTNGMKDADVGWGRANKNNIRSMLLLQEAYNDLLLRTPYLARVNGSNLLSHMVKSMEQAAKGKAVQGSLGKVGDKGLFVLGHDSDMSYFGGILGISWLLPDYQPNSRPPGAALVFELWKDVSTGKETVQAYIISQSLDQMRNVTPLSLQAPPERAPIFIPGCSVSAADYPCDWETFERLAERSIDPVFVSPRID